MWKWDYVFVMNCFIDLFMTPQCQFLNLFSINSVFNDRFKNNKIPATVSVRNVNQQLSNGIGSDTSSGGASLRALVIIRIGTVLFFKNNNINCARILEQNLNKPLISQIPLQSPLQALISEEKCFCQVRAVGHRQDLVLPMMCLGDDLGDVFRRRFFIFLLSLLSETCQCRRTVQVIVF